MAVTTQYRDQIQRDSFRYLGQEADASRTPSVTKVTVNTRAIDSIKSKKQKQGLLDAISCAFSKAIDDTKKFINAVVLVPVAFASFYMGSRVYEQIVKNNPAQNFTENVCIKVVAVFTAFFVGLTLGSVVGVVCLPITIPFCILSSPVIFSWSLLSGGIFSDEWEDKQIS